MKSKDIAGCPTKRFCLFAPLRQETLAVPGRGDGNSPIYTLRECLCLVSFATLSASQARDAFKRREQFGTVSICGRV
jgi:hypothetical protein